MDADIQGALAQIDRSWKAFAYKNKPMTKPQVKAVLEYGNQVGYKLISEFKENEIDEIINKIGN